MENGTWLVIVSLLVNRGDYSDPVYGVESIPHTFETDDRDGLARCVVKAKEDNREVQVFQRRSNSWQEVRFELKTTYTIEIL